MLFLQSYNVSTSLATKIFKQYGNQAIAIVSENLYRLADDIWGIVFNTADTIASNLGFRHEKFERLRSGIMYTLNKLSKISHCFATMQELISKGVELLEVHDSLISEAINNMINAHDLILDEDAVYLTMFFYSELDTAKRIQKLIASPRSIYFSDNKITLKSSIRYDNTQLKVIEAAINNKVLVLTDEPDTGKTTTTMDTISAYREAGAKILLAAPTGRAAERMSEVIGCKAKTIRSLLEASLQNGFQRNEDNTLDGDVLIVYECSTINILLMYSLLKALPDHITLIFVGDVDQFSRQFSTEWVASVMIYETYSYYFFTVIANLKAHKSIIMSNNVLTLELVQPPLLDSSPNTEVNSLFSRWCRQESYNIMRLK